MAFSLIEVVLAIGIISFALLPVVGLLPIGLKSIRNSNEQAAAANVLGGISGSLRSASSENSIDFSTTYAGKSFSYTVNGSPSSVVWEELDLDGYVPNAQGVKRLSAVVNITPPTSLTVPGRAIISVAWSAQSNPIWAPAMQSWSKADGSLTSSILFLTK